MFSNLPDRWSKVSHAARDLVTFSMTFFFLVTIVGQLVKTPPHPDRKAYRHITDSEHSIHIVEVRMMNMNQYQRYRAGTSQEPFGWEV